MQINWTLILQKRLTATRVFVVDDEGLNQRGF